MATTKFRLILALSIVPLVAFTCAPSPNLYLTVRPNSDSLQPSSVLVAVDKSQFVSIEAAVQEFASKFSANKSAECSPSWWWNRPLNSPCALFSNNGQEGIMVEAFYDSSHVVFRIVLVKDARVFGQFSTHEVEDAFNKLIVERLHFQYGENSVKVGH